MALANTGIAHEKLNKTDKALRSVSRPMAVSNAKCRRVPDGGVVSDGVSVNLCTQLGSSCSRWRSRSLRSWRSRSFNIVGSFTESVVVYVFA
jgi:hypothetical protein